MNLRKGLDRYAAILGFTFWFICISALVRFIFMIWMAPEISFSFGGVLHIIGTGLFMDIGVLGFFCLPITVYLCFFPKRWNGSITDRIILYVVFGLLFLIQVLTFFAEFTFWEEFKSRFNFIAVDYLIYTYEVISNINESYPLPLLFLGVALLVAFFIYIFNKTGLFKAVFNGRIPFLKRLLILGINIVVVLLYYQYVDNTDAEWSKNRYENEISKAGIYSFFAAFRSNELNFRQFYKTIDDTRAFALVNQDMDGKLIDPENMSVRRSITDTLPAIKRNVVLICVESLSADFLQHFGNSDKLTPQLDSLIDNNLWFSNMFATGTRTVRGMEALSLSIPPTPGRSIVKRNDNENLFTVGSVFKQQGYTNTFLYGGDGYFDNMDYFFSHNGFSIVDRSRGFASSEAIVTPHTVIADDEITFENAWGVCDEDLFNKTLAYTDDFVTQNKNPFFHFIMTTSNHRPYTYPEGKIDIPSGTGRKGAVKYTDYAIGKFIKEASKHSWYANTTFVIVADHCASSAGRWELDIANYRIPAIVINAPEHKTGEVNKLCSQIDLFPTLFAMSHFSYQSNLYGHDVLKNTPARALVGNYRKLGYLANDSLTVLGDQKVVHGYRWNAKANSLTPSKTDSSTVYKTVANYQTADYLYHHNGLKE